QQRKEAMAKRRVGLGFTGLGDALIMLRLRYDTDEARRMAARISEAMRDAAYRGSVELARERGAFPLFNADLYLSGTSFATRLPDSIKNLIRKHGLRNSHLLSIAPTGTISLAFADNASNGIEPPFSWTTPGGGTRPWVATSTTCPSISSPRSSSRRARTSRWWRRWRRTSTPASRRPSTCRRTTPTASSRTSISTPGSPTSRGSPPTGRT